MKRIIRGIFVIVLLSLFAVFIYFLYQRNKVSPIGTLKVYTSSFGDKINLYDEEFNEVDIIYRGTELTVYDKSYLNEDKEYRKIVYDGDIRYILFDNISENLENSIKETMLYVRTPVTVYKDYASAEILGFLPKGCEVNIVGFDVLNNGIVNMYKIKYGNEEGYIYSKYLLNNIDDAKEVYDEENTYSIHKDRKYSYELYGGYASELDYYPYEKVKFEDNIIPEETKTLYLNASVIDNIDDYIELAKESSINAFVIDIYDGYMAYQSEIAKKYSNSLYNSSSRSMEEYKNIINKIKDNDIYVIGRIVAFNNSAFASDNPKDAISYYGNPTSWISAYSRNAWQYNVELALEAVNQFGFNEIQFDYVRFPETAYDWSLNENYDFKNIYNESKAQAIQNFLYYATDKIHEEGAYVSVDVFGESAYTYVTAYGQYFPSISNIVDVISAMPYPDHFNKYDFGMKVPVWTVPYKLMSEWASYASERQQEIPTPAKVRTWIQAYDTIKEPYIIYGEEEVSDQISALYEHNLNDGFITWNSKSDIEKYKEIKGALKKDYR